MRPVFIGGCPRSGTTLLGSLLGAHSRCLCVPEMQVKVPLFRDVDWSDGRVSVEELARRVKKHWRFRIWDTEIDPDRFWSAWEEAPAEAVERGAVTYREAIEGLVRVYAAALGRPAPQTWVDHTPGNIRHGNMLLAQFPDARMIHLVRDGRAVARSVLPLEWGPNTIWEVTDWWPQWLAFGLALESHDRDRVTRVHFEELVRQPGAVLGRLCRRLQLDEEEQLGRVTEFRIPSFTRRQHELVGQPPKAGRADLWKSSLSGRDIEIFESSAGDVLESLGYDLVHGGRAARPAPHEKWWRRFRGWARAGYNRARLEWRKRRLAHAEGRTALRDGEEGPR